MSSNAIRDGQIKKIVIAAVSARPFVQAATAAGYEVISLDAYSDADTQNAANESHVVKYSQGHFDAADLDRILKQPDVANSAGLAYGSGFEALPELLEMVEKHIPLIGNTPRVLRNLKRPRQFFMLLDILKIPHPEVSFKPVISSLKQSAAGWLYKQGGGSGGTHVRKALPLPGVAPETGCYFQREIKGTPVSLLFIADGKQARVVGFNQQWISSSPTMPYRYGGAVSNAPLPESIKQQLIHAAQQLTNAVGLRGLNSLDGIMDEEQFWLLEINPRLSATFDLYQFEQPASLNLFELHMQAIQGNLGDWLRISGQPLSHLPQKSKAHQIIYAPYNVVFHDDMDWPEWVADLPLAGHVIHAHEPVCTVLAVAENAEIARQLVADRAKDIETILVEYKSGNP